MMTAPAAIALSSALTVLLCVRDPKRRRSARLGGEGQGASTRRLIAAAACLPGLACILAGDAAAFLIWLGGCGVTGWLTTLWFNRPAGGSADTPRRARRH